MKTYRIKFNDQVYEVEVEEVGEVAATSTQPAPKKAPAKPAPQPKKAAPAPKPAPAPKASSGDGEAVNAPMPGTIVDVKVKVGDSVKAGQVLVILEAMKMENEIVAPRDGEVTSIEASKNAAVALGDALVLLG